MKKEPNYFRLFLILFAVLVFTFCFVFSDRILRGGPFINLSAKIIKPVTLLSFDDMKMLSTRKQLDVDLFSRLQKQLTIPYVVNSIVGKIKNPKLERPFVRVAHWNIARGGRVDVIKNVLLNPENFYARYNSNIKKSLRNKFNQEVKNISSSDIICLNEADIGIPRTKYANITREVARTIGYNYAFAAEFIELGPIVYKTKINRGRYLGLHGNAILSRFPILSTKIIRLPDCYDWFGEELKHRAPLEHVRIVSAKTIFQERIETEVRRGGRCALLAEIKLPNGEVITVISVHLEDRCFPSCRLKQMKYLLSQIKSVNSPLVLAGDLNTSTTDTVPTSVRKELLKRLKDPHFVGRQIAFAAIPGLPVVAGFGAVVVSKVLQYRDPIFPSVPVIFPNMERELFNYLKSVRFSNGEGFDFSGDKKKSSNGREGLLANSNERIFKGFEHTFEFTEPRLIAYFKLDWFFIKPYKGRFKPFNGQTLRILNESYPGRISDHSPMTVDVSL